MHSRLGQREAGADDGNAFRLERRKDRQRAACTNEQRPRACCTLERIQRELDRLRIRRTGCLERWPGAVAEVVVIAVEMALELHHHVLAGVRARGSNRVPRRLRAGGRKAHQLRARDELRNLPCHL